MTASTTRSVSADRRQRLGLLTEPLGYVDGQNLYEYVGGDPMASLDPIGLAVLVNAQGDVIRWHTYEQLKWRIRSLITSRDKNEQNAGAKWRGAYESLWSFAQNNLATKQVNPDGTPVWDKSNATADGVPVGGPKLTSMASFRSPKMNVSAYEVNLNLPKEVAAQAMIRQVLTKIKKDRGVGNAKCPCDLIVFIGHTVQYFYGDAAAPGAMQGQGIGFLPVGCYAKRILTNTRRFGFEGITDEMAEGLMRDEELRDEGILLDAIRGLEIIDLWAQRRWRQCDSINVHVIWGSSEPNWLTNVGGGTGAATRPGAGTRITEIQLP